MAHKKRAVLPVFVVALLLMVSRLGLAQTTTATVSGLVTDATGAVVPGAQVTVTNTATGVKRSLTTGAAGQFIVTELPPGPYEVNVSASGFETMIRRGITLVIGQALSLPLAMKVGVVSQQVTVTEEAPLVQTNNSEVQNVVGEEGITQLPLNGRDFSELPLIETGTAAIRNGDNSSFSKGTGARIAMGGSRADQTGWMLDGSNIHSPAFMGTPGGASGVMLGVDAVQEFQVLTSDYSAELGGTSGGVVNMVTKSGTNALHGTAFWLLRNSDLDARNFFSYPSIPPLKRNQFGGSLGGPIKKDKTFWFADYEGLIERKAVSEVYDVPTAAIHTGLTPSGQVTIAPEVAPYMALWPLPNGPSIGAGVAELLEEGNNPITENYFVARVDHHLSDRQSLFARFTYDQGNYTTPDATPEVTDISALIHSRYAQGEYDFVVSPAFLMATRIVGNRTLLGSNEIPITSWPPSLDLDYAGQLFGVGYTGITGIGPNSQNILSWAQNLYDAQEDMQYIHGSNVMKFGVSITHIGTNRVGGSAGLTGSMSWASPQAFLTDATPISFTGTPPGQGNNRSYVQYLYGSYFQDDWKWKPNFTWNFGVRYEPYTGPSEKFGRISTLENYATATDFQTGNSVGLFKDPSYKNLSPRVGFAWDLTGDGKTAVRAGFGIFYVTLLSSYYIVQGQKGPPFFSETTQVSPGLNLSNVVPYLASVAPTLLSTAVSPLIAPDITQYHLNTPYEMKYNLSIERQLGGDMSLTVGYSADRGVHLMRLSTVNISEPIEVDGRMAYPGYAAPRINENLGQGTTTYSDGQSFYNAMQVLLKKRFNHGVQFQAAYTFSKNIDDSTSGVAQTDYEEGVTTQPLGPKSGRGLSALNQTQTLVISGTYNLPSPVTTGFLSHVLGGWEFTNIFTADTGTPFSVTETGFSGVDYGGTSNQYPDLILGRTNSNITSGTTAGCPGVAAGKGLGDPSLYFDPCAFAIPPPVPGGAAGARFYGDLGRNRLIGPGVVNFDLGLKKNFPLKFLREGASLTFSADAFNLINHPNFGLPATSLLNVANGQFVAGAGLITTELVNPRQIQFGLKLIF